MKTQVIRLSLIAVAAALVSCAAGPNATTGTALGGLGGAALGGIIGHQSGGRNQAFLNGRHPGPFAARVSFFTHFIRAGA